MCRAQAANRDHKARGVLSNRTFQAFQIAWQSAMTASHGITACRLFQPQLEASRYGPEFKDLGETGAVNAQSLSNALSDYNLSAALDAQTIDGDLSGKNGWTNNGSLDTAHYLTWDVAGGIAGQYTFEVIQNGSSGLNYSIENYTLSFSSNNGTSYQAITTYDSLTTTSGISLVADGAGLLTAGFPTTQTNTYTMLATLGPITNLRMDFPLYAGGGPGGKVGEEETLFLTEFTAVVSPIPEPSSTALLGFGALGLLARRKR